MKKIYLGIIYIITLICVLAGIGIHVGKWSLFGLSFRQAKNVVNEMTLDASDNIVNIDIDCYVAEVRVTEGNSFNVRYTSNEKIETVVNQESNNVSIYQKSDAKNFDQIKDMKVEISVPRDMLIDSLSVNNNLGDIRVENVRVTNCTIVENLGDVRVEKCSGFDTLSIDDDLGDVNVISCGDWSNYNTYLDVSLGDIRFFDNKISGNYTVDNNSDKKLHIVDSLGDISIQ